jgi:hypothetical protein
MILRRATSLLCALVLLSGCDVLEPEGERLAAVEILAESATVYANAQLSLAARGVTDSGKTVELENVEWSSSNRTVASVSSSGVVTGVRSGTTVITARADGVEGSFDLTVAGMLHAGGYLLHGGVWSAADNPHIVSDFLYYGGTLRIEAGVEIRMDSLVSIVGVLKIQGTEASPVRFVANHPDPGPGYWGEVLARDSSEISHVELTHCGAPEVSRGCIVAVGEILLQDVKVTRSGGMGIHFLGGHIHAGLAAGSARLTVRESVGHPLALPASGVHSIPSSIEFIENGSNAVLVQGHNEVQTAEWRVLGVPYEMAGHVHLANGATLTLPPGSDLRWVNGGSLQGQLHAVGTPEQPISMTSARTTPQPGDWGGVVLWGAGSVLDHVKLSYCGHRLGACLTSRTEGDQLVRNVDIRDSGGVGLSFEGGFAPESGSIRVAGTASYPMDIAVRTVPSVPSSMSFAEAGIEAIKLRGGAVHASMTWPDFGLPYDVVDGSIDIFGSSTEVILQPGAMFRFENLHSGLTVHQGALIAIGTPDAPITFTAQYEPRNPGSWSTIHFGTGATYRNRLDRVVVEYGGAGHGMIQLDSDLGRFITNSVIGHSGDCGLLRARAVHTDYLDPSLNNVFTSNTRGDQCTSSD